MFGRSLVVSMVVVAAFGCGDKKKPAPPAVTTTPPVPEQRQPAPGEPLIPPTTKQLITAVVESWTSTHARLQRWERGQGAGWKPVGASWPAVIGTSGSAWGAGIHGNGAPGRNGPVKKEGDGKSPAGAFAIRKAYGYSPEPPRGTRLDYTSSGRGDLECVDDPGSDHYARILDRKQVVGDWESSETLLRDDVLYKWVIDVAHNPEHTPRAGSCIFLHVWGGPSSTTAGCTAMDEPRLVELLRALDPAANPVFVLLPRAEYQALAVAWGLPAQ